LISKKVFGTPRKLTMLYSPLVVIYFPSLKGINILKAHGLSSKESYLLKGYALNTGRAAQGMPTRVAPAKIACLDFNLMKTKMQMGVQVLVTDPRELEKIRQR
jgi:T-complex protein 1 subunit alpha